MLASRSRESSLKPRSNCGFSSLGYSFRSFSDIERVPVFAVCSVILTVSIVAVPIEGHMMFVRSVQYRLSIMPLVGKRVIEWPSSMRIPGRISMTFLRGRRFRIMLTRLLGVPRASRRSSKWDNGAGCLGFCTMPARRAPASRSACKAASRSIMRRPGRRSPSSDTGRAANILLMLSADTTAGWPTAKFGQIALNDKPPCAPL